MFSAIGKKIQDHVSKMESNDQIDAYFALLFTFSRSGYQPVFQISDKNKNGVHFVRHDGVRPYAMIVNKSDLLFYFRKDAKKPIHSTFSLETNFPHPDEATVRIRTAEESSAVTDFLGL